MTTVDTLEAKAHELLGQVNAGKLAAVVRLLEVMVEEDVEDRDTLSTAQAKAITEADEWSRHNQPIAHEEVLAEFGLSVADWRKGFLRPFCCTPRPNALSGLTKPGLTFAGLSSRSPKVISGYAHPWTRCK